MECNYLHPMSMTHIEKTFSELVFGETFPKPTDVKLENVKYNAVIYFDFIVGPPEVPLMYG